MPEVHRTAVGTVAAAFFAAKRLGQGIAGRAGKQGQHGLTFGVGTAFSLAGQIQRVAGDVVHRQHAPCAAARLVPESGIGQKPQRHARLGQTDAVIHILTVHKQRFIEISNAFDHAARQQNAAERDKAHLLFFAKGGAILGVAAQMFDLAGGRIQRTAREPDRIRRIHKQHFWATDGTVRGLAQQGLQHIRGNSGVIVQKQHKVAAIGQRAAYADVVDGSKPQILLLGQKHRIGGQFIPQLRDGVIGRSIVQQDNFKVCKRLLLQTVQANQRILPAVVVGDHDSYLGHGHSLKLLTASMTAVICSSVMP